MQHAACYAEFTPNLSHTLQTIGEDLFAIALCAHTHTRARARARTHTQSRTHSQTHTHTCTHTHTHTPQTIGEDLFAIAVDQPFRFPATFTFVLRAFSTLEGIAKGLNPTYK